MGCSEVPSPSQHGTAGSYFYAKRGCSMTTTVLSTIGTLLPLMIYFFIAAGGSGDTCSASCFGETGKCCVESKGYVCAGKCFCTEDDNDDYYCEDPSKMGAAAIFVCLGAFASIFCCLGCCFCRQYKVDKEEWLAYQQGSYNPAETVPNSAKEDLTNDNLQENPTPTTEREKTNKPPPKPDPITTIKSKSKDTKQSKKTEDADAFEC